MRTYHEPARDIPISNEVDVLVVGSGPAGVSAAIWAGRMGAKTLLVEQGGMVGGIATAGLMSHWTGNTQGGFYEEILDRSADNPALRQTINPERLRSVLLEMLDEAGTSLRLYTFACGVIMDGSHLQGILTESKSGREAILAKVIVDASGDGDIAAKAGAPYVLGREGDSMMQPMTLMFKVGGVEDDKVEYLPGAFEDNYVYAKGPGQDLAKKEIPYPAGHLLVYKSTLPGVITCNMTNAIGLDGTKAEDLTKAEQVCRSQIPAIISFLRKNIPGFEKCYVLSSASLIGVRETRHFIGEYILTKEDIEQARQFPDWIVTRAHFNFDVHNITGSGLDTTGIQKHFSQKKGYTIPYRCLIPAKVDGLLLAGRNISGTHIAHSNYRVMPICANMGQAAGIAAALCARDNIMPRDLNVGAVQKVLLENGVQP
ncbi:MAG: FAD-dependent oxidoreductase [Christensenellales bacterium]|jgi:hypothetical protein